MINTFNRRPLSINTPNSSDIKHNYLNKYDFKGLIDNKNFLSVDPQSFSDCNNVYVNDEGLLKSRPSLKIKNININTGEENFKLNDIINIWTFVDTIVYESESESKYYLTFVNKLFDKNIQVELNEENCKLIIANRKIFIFTNNSFDYYDIDTNEYSSAEKFIYIPETEIIVNGVIDENKAESKNILTDSYIKTYIYDNASLINLDSFIGKKLKIEISNNIYEIDFVRNNQLVFVDKYTNLTESNFTNFNSYSNYILGYSSGNIPLIEIAENGVMLISSCELLEVDDNKKPVYQWRIYFTVDGLIFNKLPEISSIIGKPLISKNGYFAIVFKEDGPYIYSLLKTDENIYTYPEWTNLLEKLNKTQYDEWRSEGMSFNKINNEVTDENDYINQSDITNGYFINDDIFVIIYGDELYSLDSAPNYKKLYCIYSIEGNLKRVNLFEKESDFTFIENINLNQENIIYTPSTSLKGYYKNYMPNLYCNYSNNMFSIGVSFIVYLNSDIENSTKGYCQYYYHIEDNNNDIFVSEYIDRYRRTNRDLYLPPIKADIFTDGQKYLFTDSYGVLPVPDIQKASIRNRVLKVILKDDYKVNSEKTKWFTLKYNYFDYNRNDMYNALSNTLIKIAKPSGYILTNKYLFDYIEDVDEFPNYNPIELLFESYPVAMYYSNNTKDSIYLATKTELYSSLKGFIKIKETFVNNNNLFLPDVHTELQQHYFSKDKTLYISESRINDNNEFMWYFPEISKQSFNFNIVNLHPISSTEVAIFLPNEIYYTLFDTSVSAYRYYKTKLQVGCKKGSDVITTFDGKYVIFTSDRGLVAMSYQQFVATTEQSLTYLSDNIYNVFFNYITDINSTNEIKLFKYSYWIFIYKKDDNKGFLLDIRNMSWWPVSSKYNIDNIAKYNDELLFLYNKFIHILDKTEINYFDLQYNGYRDKIEWFIRSQKLHLGAVNYYKHINNITFYSVHDITKLLEAEYNIDEIDFKLQVNNYRKKVNGNINSEDFVDVNYDVNIIRTYVQRLNYSKVNEFEYMLSSNEENAINVPLSLSNITIKYKIGGEIR